MTREELERIVRLMGAKTIAELPGVSHGATGAAYLAKFHQLRTEELRRQEPEQGPRPPHTEGKPA